MKYGVNGCGKNKHGKSKRAESQKELGGRTKIEFEIPGGTGARQKILHKERDFVMDYFRRYGEKPDGNILPNPWPLKEIAE